MAYEKGVTILGGPMLSGKTGELIEVHTTKTLGDQRVGVFKPEKDIRKLADDDYKEGRMGFIEARRPGGEVSKLPAEMVRTLGSIALTETVEAISGVEMEERNKYDIVLIDELHMFSPDDVRELIQKAVELDIAVVATAIVVGTNGNMQKSVVTAIEEGAELKPKYAVCKDHGKCAVPAWFTNLRTRGGENIFDAPDVILDLTGADVSKFLNKGDEIKAEDLEFDWIPVCAKRWKFLKEHGKIVPFPESLEDSKWNWNWGDK